MSAAQQGGAHGQSARARQRAAFRGFGLCATPPRRVGLSGNPFRKSSTVSQREWGVLEEVAAREERGGERQGGRPREGERKDQQAGSIVRGGRGTRQPDAPARGRYTYARGGCAVPRFRIAEDLALRLIRLVGARRARGKKHVCAFSAKAKGPCNTPAARHCCATGLTQPRYCTQGEPSKSTRRTGGWRRARAKLRWRGPRDASTAPFEQGGLKTEQQKPTDAWNSTSGAVVLASGMAPWSLPDPWDAASLPRYSDQRWKGCPDHEQLHGPANFYYPSARSSAAATKRGRDCSPRCDGWPHAAALSFALKNGAPSRLLPPVCVPTGY